VKLTRFSRSKVACSPLYVDYRPKTNATILWDSHYGEAVEGRDRSREGNKKLE
jgi:hypothetical protein